jgi:nitrogen fixation/metabolism regulation signal transduction histidine kinase
VTLRWKLILYVATIHLVFAGAAVWFLWPQRKWLLAVEAGFAISIWIGVRLVEGVFGPIQLIRAGIEFIKDSDFNSRFRETGQPELDELTGVYNRMANHLREERIKVREQHHFLDQVITNSPAAIITFDFDGRIALANPAAGRILGAAAPAPAGRKLEELGTPFAAALGALETGESKVIPVEGIRRAKCQKSRFLDRGFERQFIMVEELTDELRRAEKAAYEKIIRMMSHEINNSIGASNSLLESCLNYKSQLAEDDQGDYENALRIAISRTHHLNSFIRAYADIIRLPAPDLRPCDLRRLLEDISVLMRPELERRRVSWNWAIERPLGPMPVDKNQMEQALVNVLKNAMEAIGSDGCITVRMGQNGRPWLAIEDSGGGISEEAKAALFTPFFSTKENGRGIGLTMVQEILSQHRFHFNLESPAGGPTRFTIWF